MSMEDRELLREYAERRSDKAFTELVERHIHMVYSTALRSVREPHLARDIAQTVFISLARKPASVRDPRLLAGWLYRAARFNAASALRTERRRREHENSAMQLNTLEPDSSSAWQSLAPHLDEAMENLNSIDQSALALRFFENKSLREVGQALGLSDDAAQKRVSRALDMLRSHFAKRGIATTSAVLVSALSSQASTIIPAGLGASVAAASMASAAAVGAGGFLTLINTIIMTKTKAALIAAVLVGAVAIPIISQRRENARLRREIVALRWEKAALAQQQNQTPEIKNATGNQEVVAHPEIPEAPNRSIAELVAETAALFSNAKGIDKVGAMAMWTKFLVQIPRDQMDQALLEIFKLPANEVRLGMTHVVFNMWTEKNPRAALAFATVHFRGEELSRFASDALTKWAKQEPEAAFAAWREQSSDPAKRMAWGGNDEIIVKALFEGLSKQDLPGAMKSLESLDREHLGNALAGLAVGAAKTEQGRTFFLEQLERLTDPVMKDRAIQGFMSEWAGRHDLPGAAAWVESLPIEQRGIYARSVGSAYVRSNPKAGAEWWLAQVTEMEDRRIALAKHCPNLDNERHRCRGCVAQPTRQWPRNRQRPLHLCLSIGLSRSRDGAEVGAIHQ